MAGSNASILPCVLSNEVIAENQAASRKVGWTDRAEVSRIWTDGSYLKMVQK